MTNTPSTNPQEKTKVTPEEKQKVIQNHLQTAKHFEAAAKHHTEAAKHHEEENHGKAAESTIKAHGHNSLANELQKENIKHHAMTK